MTDYVPREALIALARPGAFTTSCDGATRQEDAVPVRVIRGVPAADVVEVRWLPVVGYEGLYQVSNMGRVKSVKTNKPMAQWISKGYLMISLRKKGYKKNYLVHKLVADIFLPKNNLKIFINHKDENKLNNIVENLEWVTTRENNNYGTRNKRIAKSQLNRKDCSKSVLQFSINGEFIKEWESIADAGRHGFNRKGISCVCRGVVNYNTSGGYIWKYK